MPPLLLLHRVYTDNHLHYVAASLIRLYQQRDTITGLRRVYATKLLSHFTARFEPVQPPVDEEEGLCSSGHGCESPTVLLSSSSSATDLSAASTAAPLGAVAGQAVFPAGSAAHGCETPCGESESPRPVSTCTSGYVSGEASDVDG